MYQFNPYAIPNFFTMLFLIVLGGFILSKNKKAIPNITFALLCFSAAIWQLGFAMEYLSITEKTALFWNRFVYLGVPFIAPTMYHFSVSFLNLKNQKKFVYLFYFAAVTFILLNQNDYFVSGVRKYFWGYYTKVGVLHHPFLIVWFISGIASIINMFKGYKTEDLFLERQRRKYIFLALIIALIGTVDFLAAYGISVYPFGYMPVFVYMSLTGYSIIRYKAFEIETVIHKTAVWLLSFVFIIIPLLVMRRFVFSYIQAYAAAETIFWVAAFLIFAFYLRAIQPRIDHLFQRRASNLEEISRRFTDELVHLKEIGQLIGRIKEIIKETLYPQRVDVFIYNEDQVNYLPAKRAFKFRHVTQIKNAEEFLHWLAKNNKIVYREFIDIDPAFSDVKEKAKDYFSLTEATIVVPLALNDNLLGMINLSRKSNLKRYTGSEIVFMNNLKNQSTIAVSNSLLYKNMEERVQERTKELVTVQKQLIHAEKLATVGTLAGGVAHEINNPLTAILTNVQMLLMPGAKLDAEDRESLQLIEEATKRCRGIVQKLMTYAKKPLETTKVSSVNLLDVAKSTSAFLSYQLKQENIGLVIEAKDDDYPVNGSPSELEQVITNMILNAKDAIKQAKTGGDIRMLFSKTGEWIRLVIKDEGVGIPKDVLAKIFDPFFTTKDVGKGTGLGLAICQGIIEKHGGAITVQSELNKGSAFTIQLPRG